MHINLIGVVFMGAVWVWLAMIWVWMVGVASVLELVFKKKVGAYELVTSYRLLSKCLPGFKAQ